MSDATGVVIVNYRSADDIEARLRSGALAGSRIVIVDNASEPGRVSEIAAAYGTQVVLSPTNTGFAGGVAAGVRALGPVARILLLNPDAALTRDQFLTLGAALVPGVDGVAPLLVQPDGIDQVGVAGGPVTLTSTAGYFLGISHVLPAVTGIFLTRRQARASGGRVDWLCAGCLLLRGDAFTRWGDLPTDELVYAEDLAWGTQASLLGATFRLVTGVEVVHAVGGSGSSELWVGALNRLLRRRLGPVRGSLAVFTVKVGLVMRARAGGLTRMLRARGL